VALFRDNLEKIRQANLNPENTTFTLGVNHFADWTDEEYRGLLRYQKSPVQSSSYEPYPAGDLQIPLTVDWRKNNAVTSVKDQGRCGSDWAFSAVGAMESGNKIANGILYTLSEQQLVDCAGKPFFNHGCQGGDTVEAFKYAAMQGMM
jgi:C1A family cysteine protease